MLVVVSAAVLAVILFVFVPALTKELVVTEGEVEPKAFQGLLQEVVGGER